MTWRRRRMRLRVRIHTALVTARRNANSDSANCHHNGRSPFCLTCTTAYVRMPRPKLRSLMVNPCSDVRRWV